MDMKEVLKEEMNKSLKGIQENTSKQQKEMNETVQQLNVEIESTKKTQIEESIEIQELEQVPQRQASLTEYKKWKRESQALKIQQKIWIPGQKRC